MSQNKKIMSFIVVSLLFLRLIFSSYEVLRSFSYKISGIVRHISQGKYRYSDVQLPNIKRLEKKCLSILDRPFEKIIFLRFNYEHNCEILRYYLYPGNEAYIFRRENNLETPLPFRYLRVDYNRDIKTIPVLIEFMKNNHIRYLAISDRKNPSYENVVKSGFFMPVAYESEWAFYRLKNDNSSINQDSN